jgi:hypothetical protein
MSAPPPDAPPATPRAAVLGAWARFVADTRAPGPPPAGHLAQILYGLAQLPLGVRLVVLVPDLRRRAVLPALVVAGVCVVAVVADDAVDGPLGAVSTFFLTLVAIASLPPLLFSRSFARLAVAAGPHLGLAPRAPLLRRLRALLAETLAQALVLALGLAPLLALAELLSLGAGLAFVLGGAWTLHWIVVEALDNARTLPVAPAPPDEDAGPDLPWYARLYQLPTWLPGHRPVRRFGRFVARLGRRWRAEVALVERAPWIAAGFALGAALLLALPVVNLLFRPVVVVAAAHVWGRLAGATAAN